MDITLQLHDNECGVCVLNTFYKFFYGKDVKDELMNESKIEENGMSLYEFENLGTKYGIYSESYECTCGEIKELKHSNCFVVIVSNEKGNHYTIVKKHTRKIEFFDSVKGHYFLTYNEFERIFTGVCIFITKCERKNIIKKKYGQIFKHINFPYLIVSVLLEIFMVCIGIVSANYISIVISQNVNNSILTNVIFISIIFFTFFVWNCFGKYLYSLMINKQSKIKFYSLSDAFLKSISNKNEEFFNKFSKSYLYMIDHAIQNIANYNTVTITGFIVDSFTSIILLVVLVTLNPWYFVAALALVLMILIFGFIEYKYKTNIISHLTNNESLNNGITSQLINGMKNNNNFLQHKDTESKIKSNYSEYLKLTSQNVKFYSQLSLIMEILEKAIYMIIVCTFFMNTNGTDKVNFGSLLFSMNLLGMFNSSSNNVINFFTGRVEYAKMLEIYNNCINIGNKKTGGVDISQEQVREIKIKENNKTHIILNCDKAKFNGLSKIINKFYVYKKHEVFINGLETERIDSEKLNEKIISFNENSNFGYDMIGTNIQKSETIMNFIKKFGFKFVKDEEETSIENKQIKNFLLSSLLEDKIIIFDNCVQYISEQIREHIKLVIVPQISKKNFIIFNNETILNDKKEKIIFEDEPDLNNINLFNENEQENCFIN